ncbi:MAG: DUF134 domain-containing protein [Thermodesulfovibrionales bacterium]|nr:DUF134 domain-containing protein [Thermodesulfovibrionales bacterium]
MPRCKKQRLCSCKYEKIRGSIFKPAGIPTDELPVVILNHDELEAMKLFDMDDLTQEQAGKKMGIPRGTVQRLLMSARRKTIKAIVEQSAIIISDENHYCPK